MGGGNPRLGWVFSGGVREGGPATAPGMGLSVQFSAVASSPKQTAGQEKEERKYTKKSQNHRTSRVG